MDIADLLRQHIDQDREAHKDLRETMDKMAEDVTLARIEIGKIQTKIALFSAGAGAVASAIVLLIERILHG